MKNLFRISLFLLIFLIPQIGNSSPIAIPEGTKKDIELKGSFNDVSPRMFYLDPIRATISATSLDIEFLSNLGDINVEVYTNNGGLVYEYNIDSQTQQSISISVSDWDSGIYEIRFVNSEGKYMYGTFELGL